MDRVTVAVPRGTRLMRIDRIANGWRLWLGTRDYVVGNYILLNDEGDAWNYTVRTGEGDEFFQVRPKDEDIPHDP